MKIKRLCLFMVIFTIQTAIMAQLVDKPIYSSPGYRIYSNRVEQSEYTAKAISGVEMISDYRSPDADKYSPEISFKFSINSRDNEMATGKNHRVTLHPVSGSCVTTVAFGKQFIQTTPSVEGVNLPANTVWTIRLDMREVFKSFKDKGFYTFYNGEKLEQADFKGVYVAGNSAPLMWDFSNLYTRKDLELKDTNGDGIYETTLVMNAKSNEKQTAAKWKQANNTSAFPQYKSDYIISDAIYNLGLDEMINAVEPDSTFRTGKEWAGVWTRDISYSIILSMAYLQPNVAMYSLMRKVKNKRIIQDTGTGGAWPVSTDRMIWATAAWEVYKATGNTDWLKNTYVIIKNSIEDDLANVYDPENGMVKGESSFEDWREQTYPVWMQPADIFESECLSTNAVHYQANVILSEMAMLLNDAEVAAKHRVIADKIKAGINKYLWLPQQGYYAQFLYGRNFKVVSPRSEALGEALCVIFGIADAEKSKRIVENTPVVDFGIPCIYPQIPDIPPYHNDAVWPFVQTYWLWAACKVNNEKSVMESISAIYRPAALFLTNKENFVAGNGDFSGTQINSSNMLWSLSGNISIVHKVLFGIRFEKDQLSFKPYVPEALQGKRELTNFRYRNSVFNIEMDGYGSEIVRFELDGVNNPLHVIPDNMIGNHTLKIVLNNEKSIAGLTNQVPVVFSLPTPVVKFGNQKISWGPVENATAYKIIENGRLINCITQTSFRVMPGMYKEFQVIAVGKNNVESFASEPLVVSTNENIQILPAENVAPKSSLPYKGFTGEGFTEISKSANKVLRFSYTAKAAGNYTIDLRYANGNGPVNTENKCALRKLFVDGNPVNSFVFPQRGKDEWSNWGFSNALKVWLAKGDHIISIVFEETNENMNGEINQAVVDYLRVQYID